MSSPTFSPLPPPPPAPPPHTYTRTMQFKVVFNRVGKPVCAPSRLKSSQCHPELQSLTMAVSRPFQVDEPLLVCIPPPRNRWYGVFGFVLQTGSQPTQHLGLLDAGQAKWLCFPPACPATAVSFSDSSMLGLGG